MGSRGVGHRSRAWVGSLVCLAAVAGGLQGATPAEAEFGFEPNGLSAQLSSSQAVAHPDYTVTLKFNRRDVNTVDGEVRSTTVDLPAGLLGNPNATPKCTFGRVNRPGDSNACPAQAAVGYVTAVIKAGTATESGPQSAPVFNIEPGPDSPAAFAARPLIPIRIDTQVRPDGGYAIRAVADNLPEGAGVIEVKLTLWGVPADKNGPGPLSGGFGAPSDTFGGRGVGDRRPFLINPSTCGTPLSTAFSATSWRPGAPVAQGDAPMGQITGCDRLDFQPTLKVAPESPAAGAASGYEIDLDVPQVDDPDVPGTPTLKDAVVILPQGLTIAPGAANGLSGCTNDQVALLSAAVEQCPASSKVGNVSVTTPLLEGPISGGVYVGQPAPGNRYRLFLVVAGFGVRIKLEGRVDPDPVTGQLKATFLDNPQLPFSNLHLTLFGGPRAILANPTACGSQVATSSLSSHAGQVASPTTAFDIACPSIGSFAPGFSAGSDNPVAGAFSDFGVSITRPDDSQFVGGVSVQLPTGLLARLRGISPCSQAGAAAGVCSAASRVGTATVSVGPGTSPFTISGPVSLGGPYKGAPYSLVVAVRAIAGPYDLGTVVVRQALYVDRYSAQVTVKSDPVPTIVGGIPLRLRNIAVKLDRPRFTVNPTSCAEKQVRAALTSTGGAYAPRVARFQVAGCRSKKASPKLALRLSGGKSSFRDNGHPSLKAILTQPSDQANLKTVSVALPSSLALDPDNANGLCEFEDSLKDDPACPRSSQVGRARVRTPLLAKALTGPVYLAKNVRRNRFGRAVRTLPRLVIPLRGDLAINLRGDTSVRSGKFLVTTFKGIPDAPVSRFDLALNGGGSGILVANTRVCNASRTADVRVDGQNGATGDSRPKIAATICDRER